MWLDTNKFQSGIAAVNEFLNSISRVVVVGMGDTGLSCIRYLSGFDLDITVMDSRENPPALEQIEQQFEQLQILTGDFDQQVLLETDLIVLSPGVALATPQIQAAQDQGIRIIGDVELFAKAVTKPVIAITGSNGKSTVTALTGHLLKAVGVNAVVGGNIGLPVLDLLSCDADVYVLELSSFQLETTHSLNPQAALILNLSEDHLDRYTGFSDYARAKRRIFNNAKNIVYYRGDDKTRPLDSNADRLISFGYDKPGGKDDLGINELSGKGWICQGDKALLALSDMPVSGQHNQLNIMAALALVSLFGGDITKASQGVASFKTLPHRFELLGEWSQVAWINDSKATNPGATAAALEGQQRPVILIAGGQAKGADFSVLTKVIKRHVKAVVLIGEDAQLIVAILPVGIEFKYAATLAEAVACAAEYAQAGDQVIFSPACASFDMFDNFAQRGDRFKALVKEINV